MNIKTKSEGRNGYDEYDLIRDSLRTMLKRAYGMPPGSTLYMTCIKPNFIAISDIRPRDTQPLYMVPTGICGSELMMNEYHRLNPDEVNSTADDILHWMRKRNDFDNDR